MKTPLRSSFLVACALLIGFASASAQPIIPTLPADFRSQLTEDWDGSEWDGQTRTIQTFDGDGNVAERVIQQREDGAWVNGARQLNTYDESDRLTQVVSQAWDDEDNQWDNASRTTNTYDHSHLTQVLTEVWDEGSGNWQNGTRTTNTYDGDNLTEVLVENWTSSTWMEFTHTLNTYDGDDRLVETIVMQFGMNQSRTTSTYDNGHLIQERTETWSVTVWVNSSQTLYQDYNADDLPETVIEQTWNGADWENDTRDLNTYDGLKLTQTIEQDWNSSTSMWEDSGRITVNYDGNRITEVIEETWDGSDWANANRTEISYDSMDRVTVILSQIGAGSGWENEGRVRYSYDTVLPVELTAFSVTNVDRAARLTWTTASEINNAGFEVERRIEDDIFAPVGFVEGRGTTSDVQHYQFIDDQVPFAADRVTYRLRQVDFDGAHAYSPMVELNMGVPERLALHGNFPNPFRSRTTIRYELPQAGPAHLAVYNVLGQRVAQLLRGEQPAGRGEVVLQTDLPSGVYFLRLDAGGRQQTRQITVVK